MLTILIGLLACIVGYVCIANGQWGPFAVVAVIVLILHGMSSIERKDYEAYVGRREYWRSEYRRRR